MKRFHTATVCSETAMVENVFQAPSHGFARRSVKELVEACEGQGCVARW